MPQNCTNNKADIYAPKNSTTSSASGKRTAPKRKNCTNTTLSISPHPKTVEAGGVWRNEYASLEAGGVWRNEYASLKLACGCTRESTSTTETTRHGAVVRLMGRDDTGLEHAHDRYRYRHT